ncbi:PilW family protein [Herbaspirillum sp.]|uniref:PilW family protein n=1 Tax=Herbaspirillum sp. TaxID=1890675 RepID=UPI001B29A613|nr:PilW family protein [Herbaspirillum sp.]MBO9538874.1 PilW family protein [Herbaspirillum sp.]
MRRLQHHPQQGLTLVEMMSALAAGLLLILAATALLHNARAAYQDIDDANRVQETGRMALAHLADALRQANHLPWESALAMQQRPVLSPGLRGIDNSRQANKLDPAWGHFGAASGNGLNQSDILMLGFFGAPLHAGGGIVNCSGAAVPDGPLVETARSWVIYYIAAGAGNEPELRCRYRGRSGAWTSDAVARGIEAMQVRYAVDSDGDGRPDRWLDASAIDTAMWPRVALVRIALLVRGNQRRASAPATPARNYDLFLDHQGNSAYRFTEKEGDHRLRSVFQTTVFLRNAATMPAALP